MTDNLKKDLEILNKKFDELNNKVDKLTLLLEKVLSSTENMDNHISFVENVYTVVKKPFSNLLYWYDKNTNINELNVEKNHKKITE